MKNIDISLCTDLIYLNSKLVDNTIYPSDKYADLPDDHGLNGYYSLNQFKKINPNLKTFLQLGRYDETNQEDYIKMIENDEARKLFINNTINYLTNYDFDGLDINFNHVLKVEEGQNIKKINELLFILLSNLRDHFEPVGLMLTSSISAQKSQIQDINIISNYSDFINVYAFDYHGRWEMETNHPSPLYREDYDHLSVSGSIDYLIDQGAERSKLIIGLPFYGYSWKLSSESQELGAPASGPGQVGPFSGEEGMLNYNEVCYY